ncbi:hypothetical protein M413DRAFT_254230 [Hebeloma cylindrosporum]|uniref:Uncharacterized protein n=1 Tax=Hebeloma cylindrosporum TaxID=76867 RepID=A0A0C3C273_HEBCY|nr:hypothetical protein M413DRAFT_254230 [Hebeloma cylindrosporum h7]
MKLPPISASGFNVSIDLEHSIEFPPGMSFDPRRHNQQFHIPRCFCSGRSSVSTHASSCGFLLRFFHHRDSIREGATLDSVWFGPPRRYVYI